MKHSDVRSVSRGPGSCVCSADLKEQRSTQQSPPQRLARTLFLGNVLLKVRFLKQQCQLYLDLLRNPDTPSQPHPRLLKCCFSIDFERERGRERERNINLLSIHAPVG